MVKNAGPTTISGRELDAKFAAWKGGTLLTSITTLNAKYGAVTLPNNPFVDQGEYKLDGHQIQNAPTFTGNFGLTQAFNVSTGKLTAGFNIRYSTGYYTTPEQYLPGAYQDSYTRSNADLRYTPNTHRWNVGIWAQNLENGQQTTYVFPAYRKLVTPPCTIGVNFEVKF